MPKRCEYQRWNSRFIRAASSEIGETESMPAAPISSNRVTAAKQDSSAHPATKRRIKRATNFVPAPRGSFSKLFAPVQSGGRVFMSTAAAPRPSPEKIFDALTRYQQTFALKTGIELELFTAIGEGANEPASLAKRTQSAERGVRILADYLTIQGFLTKENGTYALTPDSAVFLDKRSPAYMGAMAEFLVSDQNLDNMQILTKSV